MKVADTDMPVAVKFLTAGTAACVADAVSFPLDTAKVRLQVSLCAHACKSLCVCVKLRKTKYVFVPCQQNAGQNDSTKVTNKSFQNVENSNIWQKHYQIKIACMKKVRAV
jgi:hypothetical protein